MNAVAYCRVSTNKNQQIDSLEAQQKFFLDYAKKNNYNLIKVYADEGKSGTKIKNRTELLKLLSEANLNIFDLVLIKDVSRLARNTVDFLTSMRRLKSLGIKVIFVNYDQTSSESSEFMLTMLSAIAQEESANTSKRVKFGKRINAQNGRVPNIVYGYDKTIGDYFNLTINEFEANVIRRIFRMYIHDNCGMVKISAILNKEGIKTKRNCKWTQTAVSRILSNELYTGKILNGKEEVIDYLTGVRRTNDKDKWLITESPNLKIVDAATFTRAQNVLLKNSNIYKITKKRRTDKYPLSKLIKCSCCNYSFRRFERTYVNTYISWICSGRNSRGAGSCCNKTKVDEQFFMKVIKNYFIAMLKSKPNTIKVIFNEFIKLHKLNCEVEYKQKDIKQQFNMLKKAKQKYVDMFENDIISIDELKEKSKSINRNMSMLEEKLKIMELSVGEIEDVFKFHKSFKDIESLVSEFYMTKEVLNKIIKEVIVDEKGNINVYLHLFEPLIETTVLIPSDST